MTKTMKPGKEGAKAKAAAAIRANLEVGATEDVQGLAFPSMRDMSSGDDKPL